MSELEKLRKEIAATDKEMAKLFEQRMEIVKRILDYKMANGLPVHDPEQEARVIAAGSRNIGDSTLKEYYILFLKELMNVSKSYQYRLMSGMKVAYCGAPGAFAQIAAERLFPEASLVPYPDFESAYRACEQGNADVTVLPIENSYSGEVGNVTDLIFDGSLHINMMLELAVTQNLLGVKGARIEDIRKVLSQHQALAQCAPYIRSRGFDTIESENTALAAKEVAIKGDKSIAAIGAAETAAIYGLEILESNINSSSSNTTRFAAFSRVMNSPSTNSSDEYFIMMFTVRDEAGALAKVLNIIGVHGFNMTNLRSRPVKGKMWKHYFFAELEGNANSEAGRDLIRQMDTVCDKFKFIGTYKRI